MTSQRVRLDLTPHERQLAGRGHFVKVELGAAITTGDPDADATSLVVGRVGGTWRAYANVCRHQAIALDARAPDEDDGVMTDSGRYLMCHAHGAIYRTADGMCVGGPCEGEGLHPVPIEEEAPGRLVARPDFRHDAAMSNEASQPQTGAGEVRRLTRLLELRALIDNLIETGLLEHLPLNEVMARMLPAVAQHVGAAGAFVESYGEDLTMQVFVWPPSLHIPQREDVFVRTGKDRRDRVVIEEDGKTLVAQPLDVAGEWFGAAGFIFAPRPPEGGEVAAEQLVMTCEELDNYLYAIRAARQKHTIVMELGHALRHRVLAEGLRNATAALTRAVPIDKMLLVYVAEENASSMLHVQLYEKGELRLDSMSADASNDREIGAIRGEGRDYLHGRGEALLARFGFQGAQEEVLINGVTKSVVVGKMVATSKSGSFNTYDREILGAFAGFIRQRVVDFNKEWKQLAESFRESDIARLLQSDDYEQRYLAPREAEVAMLYVDIAGFTKLSEQVLKTPNAVAALVEDWSHDAVNIVWAHGGVFDKMVGDCVIALFGPPFYEDKPGERLLSAIRCALEIRTMTNKLPERAGFEILRPHGLAVSTGVNMAPLFVGTFGPNSNFTGFSSGMNNTARLQGCAKRDEIVVMEEAIASLPEGHGLTFGEEQSAPVKNVAQPLRFRSVG